MLMKILNERGITIVEGEEVVQWIKSFGSLKVH